MTSTKPEKPLPLASYKIRFDGHVRAMPRLGLDGAPFTSPGVDLAGADALEVIAAAGPIVAWLEAREPGVEVRSISIETADPRVVVSIAPAGPDKRPRVVRFHAPHTDELRRLGLQAEAVIGAACVRVLARRRV